MWRESDSEPLDRSEDQKGVATSSTSLDIDSKTCEAEGKRGQNQQKEGRRLGRSAHSMNSDPDSSGDEDGREEDLQEANRHLRARVKELEDKYEPKQIPHFSDFQADDSHVDEARVLEERLKEGQEEVESCRATHKDIVNSLQRRYNEKIFEAILQESRKLTDPDQIPEVPATQPQELASARMKLQEAERRYQQLVDEVEGAKKTWNSPWRKSIDAEDVATRCLREMEEFKDALAACLSRYGVKTEKSDTEAREEKAEEGKGEVKETHEKEEEDEEEEEDLKGTVWNASEPRPRRRSSSIPAPDSSRS